MADTSAVCDGAPTTEFGDRDPIAEVFADNVNFMAAHGSTIRVDAVPNVAPGNPVAREQMATFIARALGEFWTFEVTDNTGDFGRMTLLRPACASVTTATLR